MIGSDIDRILALAIGIIFTLIGGTFVFASFLLASNFHDQEEDDQEPHLGIGIAVYVAGLLAHFLHFLLFIGILVGLSNLPQAAQEMKKRFNQEPLIKRFLLLGGLLICAGAIALCYTLIDQKWR